MRREGPLNELVSLKDGDMEMSPSGASQKLQDFQIREDVDDAGAKVLRLFDAKKEYKGLPGAALAKIKIPVGSCAYLRGGSCEGIYFRPE